MDMKMRPTLVKTNRILWVSKDLGEKNDYFWLASYSDWLGAISELLELLLRIQLINKYNCFHSPTIIIESGGDIEIV
jgi:hypothetical protein